MGSNRSPQWLAPGAMNRAPTVQFDTATLGDKHLSSPIVGELIDLLQLERIEDPKGARVKITMNGKFLPYRTW